MCNKMTGETPSRLAYGENVVIVMEHIIPSPLIAAPMDMMVREALEEGIAQLNEEDGWDLMKESNRVILGSKNSWMKELG